MTDRPINLKPWEVRAFLRDDSPKTRITRVLKPQPYSNGFHFDGRDILCHCDELPPSAMLMDRGRGKTRYTISNYEDGPEGMAGVYIGDLLWGREAWRADICGPHNDARTIYAADIPADVLADMRGIIKWRPSTHMRHSRSRLTLIVEAVKVCRVQDITEDEAREEWADRDPPLSILWDADHGPGSWDSNPWVASYTVRPVRQNIERMSHD